MDEQILRIKEKFDQVKQRDPKKQLFGAWRHRYKINTPLTLKYIEDFEKRNKLTLPNEYKQYLIQIGNGGAGPNYGVFPLEFAFSRGIRSTHLYSRHESENILNNNNSDVDSTLDEDRSPDNLIVAICISELGCGMFAFLVIHGNEDGTIWIDDEANGNGITPLKNQKDNSKIRFLDWYEQWLNEFLVEKIPECRITYYTYSYDGLRRASESDSD